MVPSCHNVPTLVGVCNDVIRTTEIISRPFAFRAAPGQSSFLSIESRENHCPTHTRAVLDFYSLIGAPEFSSNK